MKRLAHALALVLAAVLLAGCGSPRERDCRVLMPRLEEAEASTAVAGNIKPDATRLFARQAARSSAAARWLESASLSSDDLKQHLPSLLQAVERYAAAARRIDASVVALGLRPPAGGLRPGPTLARLSALESREDSPFLDEAMVLERHCGFLLADVSADRPECGALSALVTRFLQPAEGIPASAHVADVVAALAAVRSTDPAAERALRTLESLVRDVAALAVAAMAEGTAVEMVTQLRALMAATVEQQSAAKAVASEAAALRSVCLAGPAAPRPSP